MAIEGIDLFHTGYKVDRQAIKGAIVSLSVSWQIPLIFSRTPCGTAEILIMAGMHDAQCGNDLLKRVGESPNASKHESCTCFRDYQVLDQEQQKGC